MAKSFQSIRELASRIGYFLGGKPGESSGGSHQYSTLGISNTESSEPGQDHPNVKVFVEAPLMDNFDSEETHEKTCEPDIEMQTADTMKLHAVDGDVIDGGSDSDLTNDNLGQQTMQTEITHDANDSFLDLGGLGGVATQPADDFILDLDGDALPLAGTHSVVQSAESFAIFDGDVIVESADAAEEEIPSVIATEEYPSLPEVEVAAYEAPEIIKLEAESAVANSATVQELSPEAIDAIARRVVEHLSEKVVREIAWEVVPDLAELLIKQKLEEQK